MLCLMQIIYTLEFVLISTGMHAICLVFVLKTKLHLSPDSCCASCVAFNDAGKRLLVGDTDGVARLYGKFPGALAASLGSTVSFRSVTLTASLGFMVGFRMVTLTA